MKLIRMSIFKEIEGVEFLKEILEFEGGVENSQVFRKGSGTCTRLFSKILRNALSDKNRIIVEILERK
jgi:hypothetical protein